MNFWLISDLLQRCSRALAANRASTFFTSASDELCWTRIQIFLHYDKKNALLGSHLCWFGGSWRYKQGCCFCPTFALPCSTHKNISLRSWGRPTFFCQLRANTSQHWTFGQPLNSPMDPTTWRLFDEFLFGQHKWGGAIAMALVVFFFSFIYPSRALSVQGCYLQASRVLCLKHRF